MKIILADIETYIYYKITNLLKTILKYKKQISAMVSKKDEEQLLLPSIKSIGDYEDELIIVENNWCPIKQDHFK